MHAYCMTALIIRSQKIYCEKCGKNYNMFIKEERFCSNKIFQLLIKYFILSILISGITVGFLVLDGYIKTHYARTNPEYAKEWNKNMFAQFQQFQLLGDIPDYTKQFSLKHSVRWANLYYLIVIESFLVFRCIQQ